MWGSVERAAWGFCYSLLPACQPQRAAETAPLLFCLQLECEGVSEWQPLCFSPSEGLQLLSRPLGLQGPYSSSPRPDWPQLPSP